MSFFDIPGYSDWNGGTDSGTTLPSVWEAANSMGMYPQNEQPRTADTVPTSAIGSMQPIVNNNGLSGWGSWLQQGLGAVLGYGITKDAVQNGVVRPVGVTPNGQTAIGTAQPGQVYAQPQAGGINLNQLLLIGGVVLLVSKLAK